MRRHVGLRRGCLASKLGAMKSKGIVYLVGAGPGNAGLLTVRGAELLARAGVVVYDALVNKELLRLAPPGASERPPVLCCVKKLRESTRMRQAKR